MRGADQLPTIQRLREFFRYERDTGFVRWIKRPSNGAKLDRPVGSPGKDGYLIACLDKKRFPVHRLVWALERGVWPEKEIDHINGVRSDNRIENLQEVSHAQNMQNVLFSKSGNKTTGLIGAHLHRLTGKYRAQIKVDGRRLHLGLFDTSEEAHRAYIKAKHELTSHQLGNDKRRY